MDYRIPAGVGFLIAALILGGFMMSTTTKESCITGDSVLGDDTCLVTDPADIQATVEKTYSNSTPNSLQAKKFVSREGESEYIDYTNWTTVYPDSGTFQYTESFNYNFREVGDYEYEIVLSETRNRANAVSEWNKTFQVVSAPKPDGAVNSLGDFFDTVISDIINGIQVTFNDAQLLLP